MDSPEQRSVGWRSAVMRWHAGVVGCWIAGLCLALLFASRGPWAVWSLLVPFVASLLFLRLAQSTVAERVGRAVERVDRLEDESGRLRERLAAECGRRAQCESDREDREREWAAQRSALSQEAERAAERARQAQRELESLQQDLQRLLDAQGALQREHADSLQRRRVLEGQYRELESTARELGSATAQRAERHRQAQDDLQRLRATFEGASRDLEACRTEKARLEATLETARMEATTRDVRESRLEASVAEWKERAEAAREDARRLRANRALEEELADRRTEIERLTDEAEALRQQRELALEKARLVEAGQGDLQEEIGRLREALGHQEEVVASLEAENRRRHQEPRESTLDHFVWRVNSFQAREVVLEFVNRGVTIDLFEVVSEPPLQCERPSPCTLKRAAEGRVRVFSSEPLPEEIVVRCRYTLYPQEAAFRIRPSGPVKLQRL